MLSHVSIRHCFNSPVLCYFHLSYLKANKVSKSEGFNMRIIFKIVLTLFIQNYQNQSMLDKSTDCQIWLVC